MERALSDTPLNHLLKLGPDRLVASAAIAPNGGAEGGVLIKFALAKQDLSILFIRGVVESLADAMQTFGRTARRELEDPKHALQFSLRMPKIAEADWAAAQDDSRIVDTVKALVATNALALELLMQDGTLCRMALPVGVTRLLAADLRRHHS